MAHAIPWTRREVWVRKLVYPGHTLPTAAAPALVGAALAWRDGAFDPAAAVAAFAAGWLVQLGGVIVDNYENLLREPEDREHPELVAAVRSGQLTLRALRLASAACYGIALLLGAWLAFLAGPGVVAIGLASLLASWAYSAGPWPLGRIGVADPVFFLFFGIVSVAGIYFVQARDITVAALALGVPVGALTTNILVIDDIRDRAFDIVKGKRTIAVRWGARWSRAEFVAFLAVAYGWPFVLWLGLGFPAATLLPLATLPFACAVARALFADDRYEALVPLTPRAGRLLLAYCALLALGVAWQ